MNINLLVETSLGKLITNKVHDLKTSSGNGESYSNNSSPLFSGTIKSIKSLFSKGSSNSTRESVPGIENIIHKVNG